MSESPPHPPVGGDGDPTRHTAPIEGPLHAPPPRHIPSHIGRYSILRILGEGGMGTVYEAQQESPKRAVALKVIRFGNISPALLRRFEHESAVLGRLQHPGIAQVYEAGTVADDRGHPVPFFAMEFVRGVPLTDYAAAKGLGTRERLDLLARICDAVYHAHQKGVIHRDLKPGNILVDELGQPKVLDFGVARATDSDIQQTTIQTDIGQLIGTVPYMSPEQVSGDPGELDTRSDVYALGVIAYELLAGRLPYDLQRKVIHEAARIIKEEEPTRLSSINRTLRGDVETIVAKALEKEKSRRYQSAESLASDIRRYLKDEPIAARPASTWYQARKFSRRNKPLVVGIAASFLILLAGLGATLWQNSIARAETVRANDRAEAATRAEAAAAVAAKAEKARADELTLVSNFQETMLAQVDPTAAGARLTEDVNHRFDAALEKTEISEADRPGLSDGFRKDWARVNATDAATAVIDETILKPAVKAIDEQFKDQPVVEAQLRQTLARVYIHLGLYDAAMPLQMRSLEVRRRVLGEEHRDTLPSISNMATLLSYRGKRDEAESLYREALEKERRVLGEDDPLTITTLNNLGTVLHAQRRLAEAETYFREALERGRRVLGEDHSSTLNFINDMGSVLQDQKRFADAEPYFLEAVEKGRRVLGEQHRQTLAYLNNLGTLLQDLGDLPKAEACHREALEKRRLVLGEEHPDTISSISNLGSVLRAEGKWKEAEALFREALEKYRRVLGSGHPDTILLMGKLGNLLQGQGKLAEAERLYREVVQRSRPLGPENPQTLELMSNLSMVLSAQGRIVEAEAVLAEALGVCEHAFSSPQPQTALLLHHHADMLRVMGRLDNAEGEARRAVDLYHSHPEWSPKEAAHADSILGLIRVAILKGQGKLDEAIAAQREVVAALRQTVPSDSAELGGFLSALGLDLLSRGTVEAAKEAEPILRESLEIRAKAIPNDWRVPNTRSVLGGAILAVADLDSTLPPEARSARLREAEPLLLDGYTGMRDHPSMPPPARTGGFDRTREALERVVHLYEVWDKAEPGKGYDAKAADWKAKLDAPKESPPAPLPAQK